MFEVVGSFLGGTWVMMYLNTWTHCSWRFFVMEWWDQEEYWSKFSGLCLERTESLGSDTGLFHAIVNMRFLQSQRIRCSRRQKIICLYLLWWYHVHLYERWLPYWPGALKLLKKECGFQPPNHELFIESLHDDSWICDFVNLMCGWPCIVIQCG